MTYCPDAVGCAKSLSNKESSAPRAELVDMGRSPCFMAISYALVPLAAIPTSPHEPQFTATIGIVDVTLLLSPSAPPCPPNPFQSVAIWSKIALAAP